MAERTVTVRLRAVIDEYRKAMRQASSDADGTAKNIKGSFAALNQQVGALGSALTRQVTLPLVGAGVGAVKLASDFETAFSQMVGLAGVTSDEVDGLKESLLELSQQTAVGPRELASALYEASSSGLETADALQAVQVAAKASAAGMGATADIVGLAASAMSTYGSGTIDAAEATDVLTATIREGRANPRELAGSLGAVLPIASQLGVSFKEVGGAVAFLSNTFGDTSRTTSSLRAMFANMLTPAEQGRKTLEDFGLSADALKAAIDHRGLLGALDLLRTSGIAKNDVALRTLFSDVDGYTAALQLLNGDTAKLNQTFQNVGNSAGALDEAFGQARQTDAFKLKQAWAELQVALVRIGGIIAPVAADLAGGLAMVVEAFSHLPPFLQQAVIGFLAVAAAAGPAAKAFQVLADVAGPAIRLVIRQFQQMQVQLALARMEGLTTGQALRQMAGGMVSTAAAALPVAAAVTGLALTFRDAKVDADRFEQSVKNLANAIADAGSVAGGVRAAFASFISTNTEMATATANAGVTVDELTAALVEGGDAWNQIKTRVVDAAKASGMSELKWRALEAALNSLPSRLSGAVEHMRNAEKAGVKLGSGANAATAGTNDLTSALAGLSAQASMTDAEIEALLNTISGLWNATFGVADAQTAAADAFDDVASAARSGGGSARNLEQDQRSLERATKDVTKAQQELAEAEAALAEARKGPTARELSDAGLDVREAQLGVKEAQRAQKEARERLREAIETDGDVAGARLDVERANIQLKRAQDRLTDAQAAQNKVMKSGSETSDKVKDALKRVEDAQDRLTDATERQNDAERQLRGEGATGGPVADRARNIASALDRWREAQKSLIDEMVKAKRPADEIISTIDGQITKAQELIDTYGDPEGKLQKFIDQMNVIRGIFADQKFKEDADKLARATGVIATKTGVIIDMGGGDAPLRAKGGPVTAGQAYVVGEEGWEVFVPSQSGKILPHPDALSAFGSSGDATRSAPAAMAAPAWWSQPVSPMPSTATPNIELHVHTHADADMVKFTDTFVRMSRHNAVALRVASDV